MTDLELRVHTSRLLGSDSRLVLHGGGNTSVKIGTLTYVKASGWNLDTIEEAGFAPCYTDKLVALLSHESLSDTQMVELQREAMSDQSFPNPSIEAILHALIPFKFVDHTHADDVVTISNSINGRALLEEIYGEKWLIVPYIMPGFELAKKVYEMSREVDWASLEGIILEHHGIFTFDEDGMVCYQKMLDAVAKSSDYLHHLSLNHLKDVISEHKGYETVCLLNTSALAKAFASMEDLSVAQRGVLTPEHIIRTKRTPVILFNDFEAEIAWYIEEYEAYFARHATTQTMLNPAPNWAIIRGVGTVSFGKTEKEAKIIEDITMHTMEAMLRAEALGGYVSIDEAQSFAMEYWELEQAKLKK